MKPFAAREIRQRAVSAVEERIARACSWPKKTLEKSESYPNYLISYTYMYVYTHTHTHTHTYTHTHTHTHIYIHKGP
jgi:hypothetical protein